MRQCLRKAIFILKENETLISDTYEDLNEICKLMKFIKSEETVEIFLNIDDESLIDDKSIDNCHYIPSESSIKADSISHDESDSVTGDVPWSIEFPKRGNIQ